jgi:hypothetical protein
MFSYWFSFNTLTVSPIWPLWHISVNFLCTLNPIKNSITFLSARDQIWNPTPHGSLKLHADWQSGWLIGFVVWSSKNNHPRKMRKTRGRAEGPLYTHIHSTHTHTSCGAARSHCRVENQNDEKRRCFGCCLMLVGGIYFRAVSGFQGATFPSV